MGQLSNNYGALFNDDDAGLFEQLDKYAGPLREKALSIVNFIEALSDKTAALQDLSSAYNKLETLPVRSLCSGIEDIKSSLLKVEFVSTDATFDHQHQTDFVHFFQLQNEFNAEVNTFVKKLIQLEMTN